MTLPDKLTVSRIALTFVFMVFLFSPGIAAKTAGLVTFIIASLTDYLDGYIAKKHNISTDFGRLMDPIADKILVLAAFLAFVEMRLIPAWIVVIIILREITVTGLRLLALGRGTVISANDGGKHKMVSQVVTIVAILLFLVFREAGISVFRFWDTGAERIYKNIIFTLALITVILTTISGVSYLVRNKEVYTYAKKD